MKRSIPFFAVFVLLSTQFASAQSGVSPAEEAEWQQIRQIKEVYEKVAETGNVDPLTPYLAPGFTAVMVTGEEVKSVQDLKNYNAKIRQLMGEGGTYSMKATYEPGLFFGSTAVGFGTTQEKVTTSEKREYDFSSRWSALLTKQDGAWKLLRVHVSMDPISNTFVTSFRERATRMYGVGGLIIGLFIGAMVGRSRKAA